MQLADRAQFDSQLGALCAGFNVPVTELRSEAYWRGLERMQLSQFARVVSHALGEDGPERIPTASQCWVIWKQIRHRRPQATAQTEPAEPQCDHFHGFGQITRDFHLHCGSTITIVINAYLRKNGIAIFVLGIALCIHLRYDEAKQQQCENSSQIFHK